MTERWLGITASTESVLVVDAEIPDDSSAPIVIVSDASWAVQKGDRASAYAVLHQQCADYVHDHNIDRVIIKASAVAGKGSATLGLLHGAEVRGVLMAAASAHCSVTALTKALISKTYGNRKVDEYVADDGFWAANTSGKSLRKMSREPAMLLIAVRNAS